MRRNHGMVLAALLGLLLLAAWALLRDAPYETSSKIAVSRFTLRNGLEVLVLPNRRVPAVVHLLLVKAGGADDPNGKSGLAHYLEHLMFTGTKEYPEGIYENAVVRAGGEQNAFTARDYTGYYSIIPPDQLANVMAMEVDRLQHLRFEPKLAARELNVITEERQTRTENSAANLLSEQLDAITYLNHPYGQPLIGWAEDMASFTAADAKAFFETHYVASNMVLVLAGDITPATAKRLAEQYYAKLPTATPPKRQWPKEPPHRLAITASMVDEKAQEPRVLMQVTAPSLGHGNSEIPLSLFAQYLGGGQTSLLYRKLVMEQKLATAIEATYDGLTLGPALFRLAATPAPGISLETLRDAMAATVEHAIAAPIDEADLARAKTGLKAEVLFAQDGLFPMALLIGHLVMLGKDEQYFYDWSDALDRTNAEEIQKAARETLSGSRFVTGFLMPKPSQPHEASHVD